MTLEETWMLYDWATDFKSQFRVQWESFRKKTTGGNELIHLRLKVTLLCCRFFLWVKLCWFLSRVVARWQVYHPWKRMWCEWLKHTVSGTLWCLLHLVPSLAAVRADPNEPITSRHNYSVTRHTLRLGGCFGGALMAHMGEKIQHSPQQGNIIIRCIMWKTSPDWDHS